MNCGPYASLAKLNVLLCAASGFMFLVTIFTTSNIANDSRLLLVCGGASIVFYHVYKLLMNTSRVA